MPGYGTTTEVAGRSVKGDIVDTINDRILHIRNDISGLTEQLHNSANRLMGQPPTPPSSQRVGGDIRSVATNTLAQLDELADTVQLLGQAAARFTS